MTQQPVRDALGAFQFLTRVPIRLDAAVPHARVLPWFPVVGLVVGAIVGGAAAGLGELVPSTLGAAIAVTIGLLITGAFHEDGLADIADAFGGGWTTDQRLEILKDSRHGTYGVTAIVASVLLRVTAAGAILDPAAVFASFVAAHTLGRSAAVVALRLAPPARDSGLGVDAADSMRTAPVLVGVLGSTAVVAALTGWWVLPFIAAAAAGLAVTIALAVRKVGGLVGDVLGAIEQVVECAVLIVAAGLAARYSLWWT